MSSNSKSKKGYNDNNQQLKPFIVNNNGNNKKLLSSNNDNNKNNQQSKPFIVHNNNNNNNDFKDSNESLSRKRGLPLTDNPNLQPPPAKQSGLITDIASLHSAFNSKFDLIGVVEKSLGKRGWDKWAIVISFSDGGFFVGWSHMCLQSGHEYLLQNCNLKLNSVSTLYYTTNKSFTTDENTKFELLQKRENYVLNNVNLTYHDKLITVGNITKNNEDVMWFTDAVNDIFIVYKKHGCNPNIKNIIKLNNKYILRDCNTATDDVANVKTYVVCGRCIPISNNIYKTMNQATEKQKNLTLCVLATFEIPEIFALYFRDGSSYKISCKVLSPESNDSWALWDDVTNQIVANHGINVRIKVGVDNIITEIFPTL